MKEDVISWRQFKKDAVSELYDERKCVTFVIVGLGYFLVVLNFR